MINKAGWREKLVLKNSGKLNYNKPSFEVPSDSP